MIKGKTKKTALIVLAATLFVSLFSVNAVAAQNLLENPGAETGDMSGWTIIANGGDGWGIWGVDTTGYGGPYDGIHCFLTSYEWCNRSQEIDLLAKGYTEAQLDSASTVKVGEWFGQANQYCGGMYYLNVELRDEDHNVIAYWNSGVHNTTWRGNGAASWDQLSHDFSGYGPGLRYIYWEDGSKDENWWEGYYGAKLDAASVTIAAQVPEYNVFGLLALLGILAVVLTGTLKKRKKN